MRGATFSLLAQLIANLGRERIMLIRFKTWLLALTCCLVTSPVFAGGTWNSSIIVNAGFGKEQGACTAPWLAAGIPGGTCSERQPVYRAAYDYNFTPHWGFEISYGDLAKAVGHGTCTLDGYPGTWRMKSNGWAISGTGTFPMGGGLSLLGKIGGVRAEFDESLDTYCASCSPSGDWHAMRTIYTAKNSLAYGLGLQYDFNERYAIRAQYENFGKYNLVSPLDGSTIKVSLAQITAGFVLKF
jgi:opacity protein-like surface antigen